MKGNAFLNAFKVLRKKPAVLLLLFPVHAFSPLLLLLLPLLNNTEHGSDDAVATIALVAVLLVMLLAFLYALTRSVLLISPAMELLRDGAEAVETPAGWFLRGVKRHWWKRSVLACAEYSLNLVLSTLLQFLMIPLFLIIPLFVSPESGDWGPLIAMFLLMYVIMFFIWILTSLIMFVVESLGAFLLAAFADRGFAQSFRAVFGRTGRQKFYKLLGGRFLIWLLAALVIAFVAFGGFFVALLSQADFSMESMESLIGDTPVTPGEQYPDNENYNYEMNLFEDVTTEDVLPVALILVVCWLLYSAMEIYRFAYEFCVFQEVKNEEAGALLPKNA